MIGWIKGQIIDRPELGRLVVDVQGVGYDVETSLNTFFQLESKQEAVGLHIHTIVREDALLLYGFLDKAERTLFRALIKVNGVGPKLAMSVLSSVTPLEFFHCVASQATESLIRLPGVGKKTAERILMEMKDKVPSPEGESGAVNSKVTQAQDEAVSALEALGYKPQEAVKMIKAVDDGARNCEALIREALKALS